jgi:hypothetical protein
VARTPEGRRLTEEHKRAQIRLGALAAALTVENAKRLDSDNLNGTEARWAAAQAAILLALRRRSQVLAEEYLRAFWDAEDIEPTEIRAPELTDPREAVAWVVPVIRARTALYARGG